MRRKVVRRSVLVCVVLVGAVLLVPQPVHAAGPRAPVIVRDPVSLTLREGEHIVLRSRATGSPKPKAEWQSSADGGKTWEPIPGETRGTLREIAPGGSEASALMDKDLSIRVVYSNASGIAVSNSVTVTILFRPKEGAGAFYQTLTPPVKSGTVLTFEAYVFACPAPTVQWQVKHGIKAWADIPGATKVDPASVNNQVVAAAFQGTYTLVAGVGMDRYQYRARFTNNYGGWDSNPITLYVSN